jgi:hypothetical protein
MQDIEICAVDPTSTEPIIVVMGEKSEPCFPAANGGADWMAAKEAMQGTLLLQCRTIADTWCGLCSPRG